MTHIEVYAFSGCNKLKDIYYAKTQAQWDQIANSDQIELQNARLHCNVENIESHWTSSSVPATCTEDGETAYTCPCGFSYTEVLAATGHVDENTDGKCDVCGETTDAVKTAPAIVTNQALPALFIRLSGFFGDCSRRMKSALAV